jgi:hypothetical protein
MSTTLYDLTVGTYMQIVEAATNVLQKGADHCNENGIPLQEVVDSRLYPDMATFHFQVACITHHSVGALNGIKSGEFGTPDYPETDYAGLQDMTRTTLDTLKGMNPDDVNALAGGSVIFKLRGNEIPFTTENFVLSFSLPNFYFHTTTAYDILRSKGVPIGKRNFLGAMKVGI